MLVVCWCWFDNVGTFLGLHNKMSSVGFCLFVLTQYVHPLLSQYDDSFSSKMINCLSFAVRGMMYYRKALMLQTYLERITSEG